MSSDAFLVWGFDGELKGNEDRLQARLPMFHREGGAEVFLARTLHWSPSLPDSDVIRIPATRAAEYGERLETDSIVPVEPGKYVVVFGSRMRERLAARNIPVFALPAQDGFGFTLMSAESFTAYAATIEKWARREFDAAIACGAVTDAARDALAIMRNSGVGQLRDHLLRTLVMHKLVGESDQFRRVLRLAARRLRDDPEQLKKAVDDHLEFVYGSTAARAASIFVPGASLSLKPLYNRIVYRKKALKGEPVTFITVDKVGGKTSFYGSVHHPMVSRRTISPSLPSVDLDDTQELTNWIVSEE